jgi:heat shock protein HtpX
MMWELIRANKRNSAILMAMMAAVLTGLGLVIGSAVAPGEGSLIGVAVAFGLWLILALVSLSSGDQILLSASHATPVTHDVHPTLFNVVEEMKIAAGLPKMPKIYIINDPAPNAFATGRNPENASIAVTAGLLAKLNRDELQGVIAHEMSHILHRDILYVTLAGVMLGAIVMLSNIFLQGTLRGSMVGSSRRYSDNRRGGAQGQAVMILIAVVVAILAPLMARLLYYSLSRRREYMADAGSARLTRYPEGLASALEKIANDRSPQLATVSQVTAPLYIANPFKPKGSWTLADLSSTHPPISERIRVLRGMGNGASYADYAQAFGQVTHKRLGVSTPQEQVPLRGPQEAPATADSRPAERTVGDIMRKANGFAFLTCACGLGIKVPPSFKSRTLACPRCGKTLQVPLSI